MKVDSRGVEALLRDPSGVRAVLLFGEDAGMVRARAGTLVRAAAGALDDPFRIAEIEPDTLSAIPAEMASVSLTGGRRVVRVRDADDRAAAHVQAALSGPGAGLLVLEAGALNPRSKLRVLAEKAADVAVIGCYPLTGSSIGPLIRARLHEAGVQIDPDAQEWLTGRLGADHAVTLSELDKLALYAGPRGRVDLETARICVGDLSGLSLDDALHAATAGEVIEADRALELAMAEGAAPVQVLRAGLGHVQRLQRARLAMGPGTSPADAVAAMRPPVHFRRKPALTRALGLWSAAMLGAAGTRLWDAEQACKRTGSPAETLARSAVLGLAHRAAALRRRN